MKRISAVRYSLLFAATAVFFSNAASADTDTAAEAAATDSAEPAAEAEVAESADADTVAQVNADGEPADADAKEEGEPKADAEVSETTKKPAKKAEADKEDAASNNPALAAGGVVGGGSSFPLGITASLNNQVGAGTFAPGYTNNPSVQTSVSLRPFYRVHKFVDWQPNMIVNASLTTSIEWASSFTGAFGMGPVDRQLRISDMSVALIMPALIKIPFVNIVGTPVLRAIAPLSLASRYQNRAAGFGAATQFSWNTPIPWNLGVFGVQYTPSASSWTFTQNAPTMPCGEDVPVGLPFLGVNNPADGVTSYAPAVGRVEEYVDDAGNCRIRGRQIVGGLVNSGVMFWNFSDPTGGNHTFAGVMGTQHILFRPLEDKPELRSDWAQAQSYVNIGEFTFGDLSYTYNLPIKTNVSLTAGLTSFQGMFDQRGMPRLPFFDLNILANHSEEESLVPTFQGGNNLTAGYLTLTVGI